MKRVALIIMFSIMLSFSVMADDQQMTSDDTEFMIKGKVTNHETDEPFSYGNIILKKHVGDKITSTVYEIREDGTFRLPDIPIGTYSITIDIFGASLKTHDSFKYTEFRLESDRTFDIMVMPRALDYVLVWVGKIRDFMWGNWMILLLVGTGVLVTFATRFVQIRRLFKALGYVFKGNSKSEREKMKKMEGDISPFQALMTALAATVGNGNIAGVATAIAVGGPGAPLWMWIAGFFGMATKYAEGFLGVKFRIKNKLGEMAGGPMYYAREGIKNKTIGKALGATFAVMGGVAALFGTGNMAQSNSMALAVNTEFNIPFWVTGLLLAIFTGIVTIGGIKRIGEVTEKLVPSMIFLYFGGALIIILANFANIPEAFKIIFEAAFTGKAAAGALIGTSIQRAISIGVSRGVLSNESGMGTASIAQAASSSPDPTYNGLIAMTGTFIDTIVVNTLTTLSIVLSGMYLHTQAFGVSDGLTSTALTQSAFNTVIPFGGIIVAVASLLFGYSTLIAWSYYGEKCLEYLFGVKIIMSYRLAFVILIFVGAIIQGAHLNIIWYIGDISNALLIIPNVLAIVFLTKILRRETINKLY